MTCLLGSSKVLSGLKGEFEGTIKLIFQHAEETIPGGAIQMIDAGALQNPEPTEIFGQHVFPDLEVGKVGFRSGKYMASNDEINLYVKGRGGHAAMPERVDDTVLATAHILVALQRIVRQKAHQLIIETAQHTAKAFGCECDVEIAKGYPFLTNDELLTSQARKAAIEYLGEENVVELEPRMTAEDFARYSQLMPACFYRLGTANKEKGIVSNLHTSTFNVDEKSIGIGASLMTWIALRQLKTNL